MTQIPTSNKKSAPHWRVFWRPLLLMALGFHALLLFFPWQSLQLNSSQQEEGESVKLSRLTTLKPGESDEDKAKAEAEAQRRARQSDLKVKASPSPSPSPSQLVKPSPSPSPSPSSISRPVRVKVAPSPQVQASPDANADEQTAKLTQKEQVFVSRLQKLEGREVTEPVSSILFPDPEDFYKDPIKEIGQPGIVGIEYVSMQRPEEVYQQLKKLYPDYTISPKPDYGNGPVYQFKKGDFVRYMNLVRAKLGAGTLVILWSRQPT